MIRSRHIPKAFSMVELVLVMAIIALTAAIAVPKYASAVTRFRADAAAQRVVTELRYAQSLARTTSIPRTVVFDKTAETCTILATADLDHPTAPHVLRLTAEPFRCQIISASFSSGAQVTYDIYGQANGDGTIVVQAESLVSYSKRTIRLDASGDLITIDTK